MSISETKPVNSRTRSTYMVKDKALGRQICLSRAMILKIKDTNSVRIKINGPDHKGKYQVALQDTTRPGSPINLFTTTFIYENETQAEDGMKSVLSSIKDLLI